MKMAQPLKKFSAGQVFCALWENQATVSGHQIDILKASIERRYKDSSGTWKSANSFSRNEIPLAIYGLMKALVAMVEEKGDGEESGGG
ncbi:MAG: hypothetical protein V3V86_08300 [Gammaproteobacteria bacterium]